MTEKTDIVASNLGQGFAFSVNVGMLNNWAAIKDLFDYVTITGFDAVIIPQFNSYQPVAAGSFSHPRLTYAVNRDSTTPTVVPAAELEVLQEDNVKIKNLNRTVTIRVRNTKAGLEQTITGNLANTIKTQQSGKKLTWLATDDADIGTVYFGGVNAWLQTTYPVADPFVCASVYYRVYYAAKEQR